MGGRGGSSGGGRSGSEGDRWGKAGAEASVGAAAAATEKKTGTEIRRHEGGRYAPRRRGGASTVAVVEVGTLVLDGRPVVAAGRGIFSRIEKPRVKVPFSSGRSRGQS